MANPENPEPLYSEKHYDVLEEARKAFRMYHLRSGDPETVKLVAKEFRKLTRANPEDSLEGRLYEACRVVADELRERAEKSETRLHPGSKVPGKSIPPAEMLMKMVGEKSPKVSLKK